MFLLFISAFTVWLQSRSTVLRGFVLFLSNVPRLNSVGSIYIRIQFLVSSTPPIAEQFENVVEMEIIKNQDIVFLKTSSIVFKAFLGD